MNYIIASGMLAAGWLLFRWWDESIQVQQGDVIRLLKEVAALSGFGALWITGMALAEMDIKGCVLVTLGFLVVDSYFFRKKA